MFCLQVYVGGKPRKKGKRDADEPKSKRERGAKKTLVVGTVERGGRVIARVFTNLPRRKVFNFIKEKCETRRIRTRWRQHVYKHH